MRRYPPLLLAIAALLLAPVAEAAPRVTVSGAATTQGKLTAKVTGGKTQSITWERCASTARVCPGGASRVGTGRTYVVKVEDLDFYLRAVVRIKRDNGKTATVRSAWKGPVKTPSSNPGTATGMEPGLYRCSTFGSGGFEFTITGASTYALSSSTGTYRLDRGARVYQDGAIKIDWLTGTYADWQRDPAEPFWAEYIPVGTPGVFGPYQVATVIMTFEPGDILKPDVSGWTTCTRR